MLNLLGLGEYSSITPSVMEIYPELLVLSWRGRSNAPECGEEPPEGCITSLSPLYLVVEAYDSSDYYLSRLPRQCSSVTLPKPFSFIASWRTKSGSNMRFASARSLLLHNSTLYAVCRGVISTCGAGQIRSSINELPLSVVYTELDTLADLMGIFEGNRNFPLFSQHQFRDFITVPAFEPLPGFCCENRESLMQAYPLSDCEDGCAPVGPWLEGVQVECVEPPDDDDIDWDKPPPEQSGFWRVRVYQSGTQGGKTYYQGGGLEQYPSGYCEGDATGLGRPPVGPASKPDLVPATDTTGGNFLTVAFRSTTNIANLQPIKTATLITTNPVGAEVCGAAVQDTTFEYGWIIRDNGKNPAFWDERVPYDLTFRYLDGNIAAGSSNHQFYVLEVSYDGENWVPFSRYNPEPQIQPLPPDNPLAPSGNCQFLIVIKLSITAEIPFTINVITGESNVLIPFKVEITTPEWIVDAGTVDLPCAGENLYTVATTQLSNGVEVAVNWAIGKVVKRFLPVPAQVLLGLLDLNVDISLLNQGPV